MGSAGTSGEARFCSVNALLQLLYDQLLSCFIGDAVAITALVTAPGTDAALWKGLVAFDLALPTRLASKPQSATTILWNTSGVGWRHRSLTHVRRAWLISMW